jgi:hypothetical protein
LDDPTGLEPAPYGLKGRCSATRVPGQEHCRLPIADCRFWSQFNDLFGFTPIGNRQLAIGNNLAVAEGFEPSMGALTMRCLTNLATPQTRTMNAEL